MKPLTSKQRAELRRLAHRMKPVVIVGNEGVTHAVVQSVKEAFNTRELLKIKSLESAPAPIREISNAIAAALGDTQTVQTVGRTAILYRPDPEEPELLR